MKRGVDYIGVGVGAAIFDRKGHLFLGLRGKNVRNERGKWQIPGGSVEFGETLEQALKREILEEHRIIIDIVELLGICDHIIPAENQHWVSPTYACIIKNGTPVIAEPEMCEAIQWFTLDEAAQLPLSIKATFDIDLIRRKYPTGIPNFYKS